MFLLISGISLWFQIITISDFAKISLTLIGSVIVMTINKIISYHE
jgi:hypothetical protein